MGLKKFGKEGVGKDELNGALITGVQQAGLNLIRQLQNRSVDFSSGEIDAFAEAYTSNTGREGTVDTDGSSATYLSGDNAYGTIQFSETYYVIIEADNVDEASMSTSEINVVKKTQVDRWLVYDKTNDSDEVKRARIYKRLFSDQRIVSDTTNVTSLETSASRDQGKRAYRTFDKAEHPNDGGDQDGGIIERDFTFSSTSGNSDVSAWSDLQVPTGNLSGGSAKLELPKGNVVHSISAGEDSGVVTSDEISTDTTSDETDNPADAFSRLESGRSNDNVSLGDGVVETVFLSDSAISFSVTTSQPFDGSGSPNFVTDETDFTGNQGIPAFTAPSSSFDKNDYFNRITHNVPSGRLSADIDTAIGVPLIDKFESGASVEYKLTNSSGDDTGWLPAYTPVVSEFAQFTSEPETLKVRLTPKNTSPSMNTPSIKGFYVNAS